MLRRANHCATAFSNPADLRSAHFPALRAVVAEGGYHDFADEIARNTPPTLWFAPLFRSGAEIGYQMTTGLNIRLLSPVSVIEQIAPRPILLIYGTNEPGLNGARLQQAAAGSNAELWEVPGAGHGNYAQVAPREYRTRVSAFMESALNGD